MKDVSFDEENEARLSAVFVNDVSDSGLVHFREGQGRRVPYIVIPIGDGRSIPNLRKIVVGPSEHKEQEVSLLQLRLQQMGFSQVRGCPLQNPLPQLVNPFSRYTKDWQEDRAVAAGIFVNARFRGRKVRTPQGSVPDNVRDAGFKAHGRPVPQKRYRHGYPSRFFGTGRRATLETQNPSWAGLPGRCVA